MSLLLLSLLACRNGGDSDTPDPVDTGCTTFVTAYPDQDSDSYGTEPAVEICAGTIGFVPNPGDCDDTDPSIYPGATDLPLDDIDQDCDGTDNRDGDGDGDPIDTDCDDSDPDRSTLLFELCDTGVDEDCDGIVDEDCQYFGGVASGVADHRIEGIWVDDWQNNSRAGRGVFGLPDISGDGVPDIAVAGDTYDERFVHIFSGQEVLDNEVVDFDDALFAVSSANGAGGLGEIEFMGVFSSGSNQYLVVQDDLCDVFDLSDRPEGDPLYWGDGLFGYGHGTCHLALLDHALPTNIHLGGASLFLRNYLWEDESYQTTSIDLDGTIPIWSATDDWNGDGVNEIFVGSYDRETEGWPQKFWHGEGPFELDTDYPSDVLTLVGSTEPGQEDLRFNDGVNRPELSEDLNNDGLPELFIETINNDAQRDLRVWTDTAQIGLTAPDLMIVSLDHNFNASNLGTFHFGDINCDGQTDLVQQYGDQRTGHSVVALALGPLGTGTLEIQSDPDGTLSAPERDYPYSYGYSTTFVDDMNGDGCQELLIGDPYYKTDPERFGPGAAHLFLGAPGGL
jgi:hypothetical protein